MFAEKVLQGDFLAAAKLMSMVERQRDGWKEELKALGRLKKKAHVVGVTGTGGAGKSTLISKLIGEFRRAGKKIGVIACDPRDVESGGAFLGDRIRMAGLFLDPNVFIRSVVSDNGISHHTKDFIRILSALGMDIIVVETAGVGQEERKIRTICQTLVLVLTPEFGDEIQLMKGGLIQLADIVVLNKGDHPKANIAMGYLSGAVFRRDDWQVPIIKCVSSQGTEFGEGEDGMNLLFQNIIDHLKYLKTRQNFRKIQAVKGG